MGEPYKQDVIEGFPVDSAELEPAFAHVIGRLFARVQAVPAEGIHREDLLRELWMALRAMGDITRIGATCPHAGTAVRNHQAAVARMIESELGVDPFRADGWKR